VVRPTAAEAGGLHVRAGNAMVRTRDGVLDGALVCLARDGVRGTTMGAIATAGGVAKATLYNHFRTKADVWAALIDREVRRIAVEMCALDDRAAALDLAAQQVGSLAVVRALASTEPESLVPLLRPDSTAGWRSAREAVAMVVGTDPDDPAVDLVLRWLVSQLLAPQPSESRSAVAALLARSHPLAT